MTMKVYVVVTILMFGDQELFADVVLLTPDEKQAKKTVKALQKRKNLYYIKSKTKVINYDTLQGYDNASYFQMDMETGI